MKPTVTEVSRKEGISGKYWKSYTSDQSYSVDHDYVPTNISVHLRCGCDDAFLKGYGQPLNGHIEAEYACSYGLSYYLTFRIHEDKKEKPSIAKLKKRHIEIDKYGQPLEDKAPLPELEEL